MLITFEGLDYSGKTTQATLLIRRLQNLGKEVVYQREPGGTAVSEKIREILLSNQHSEITQVTEFFLFSAARTQLVREVIQPALRSGKIVICDRFYDSTTAYQGYGRMINLEGVAAINRIATLGIIPDITFYIDIPVDEISRRQNSGGITADRMESSGREFYERVRNGYRSLAESEAGRFVVLDGLKSIEELHGEIWRVVQKRIE